MVRIKRGTTASKRRKNTLKHTKGFKWGRNSKFRLAKEALMHAWTYAYRDRRNKKRDFRRLWQVHISSATKEQGLSYSKFIKLLKDSKVELDRKILSDLAENNPEVFKDVIKQVTR
ncbi:50S ribosomal protein L20 [Patescibacteria group bacterium]|nr:50S ribosomal protein L20 [Patescibacteria group bacterium]